MVAMISVEGVLVDVLIEMSSGLESGVSQTVFSGQSQALFGGDKVIV